MPFLFLMRHGKAAKAEPGMADFDRPLEPRGVSDAGSVGAALRERWPVPGRALCSAAKRTRETLDATGFALRADQVTFSRPLFDADAEGYLAHIRAEPGPDGLLVVGHNPSIAEAALLLAGSGDDEGLARLARGFPTSGVAVIEVDEAVTPGRGVLQAFLHP